jgi:outer membrane immunogenic protein
MAIEAPNGAAIRGECRESDMKRFLLAALAVATLAGGSAGAADMGAPPPPVRKVAPPVAVYSWSGPYWGVNVGYSWGRLRNDWTVSGLLAS